MIQIRNGVFETNSSSSHSLVVMTEGRIVSPEETAEGMWINNDGEVGVWDHDIEYGRSPFRVLATPFEKLLYTLAEFQGTDQFQSIYDRFIEKIPELKKIDFPMVSYWRTDEPTVFYGDIDHQSAGMLKAAIQKEGVDPLDIVFDSRYVIIVDGDEYCVFGDMLKSGLIDKSKIKTVYPYPLTEYEE